MSRKYCVVPILVFCLAAAALIVYHSFFVQASTINRDIRNTASNDSYQWPSSLPETVPALPGTINNITKEDGTDQDKYCIDYQDLANVSLKDYQTLLQEKGWTINSSAGSKKSWQINATHPDKMNLFISVDSRQDTGFIKLYLYEEG